MNESHKHTSQHHELTRAKRTALRLLCLASGLFVMSIVLPHFIESPKLMLVVSCLKTVSEAAMIGALADWFAVRALFQPIGIPWVRRHTNIIPKNKSRIADNLAAFVQEKFFHEHALKSLVRENDPAGMLAEWLGNVEQTEKLTNYLIYLSHRLLNMTENSAIQRWLYQATQDALQHIDLPKTSGNVLAALTEHNKHHDILNHAIDTSAAYLTSEKSKTLIADSINEWLKQEYPKAEKIMPVSWLSKNGASVLSHSIINTIDDMHQNPEHPLRQKFDTLITQITHDLKDTTRFEHTSTQLKHYALNDEAFNAYLRALWQRIAAWLEDDLSKAAVQQNRSYTKHMVQDILGWVSQSLRDDTELRKRINLHIEQAMTPLAPELAHFITNHIRHTLVSWPDKDLVSQIELNIGKDLHYIRINGTVVGALIGFILFWVAQIPALFF